MSDSEFDLVVIGAGPGGYHSAIRGAQLGLKTAVVEKDNGSGIGGIGGVCLNWGCIPSKSLLKNAELVNTLSDADAWGISLNGFSADISMAVDRSRKVSNTLTKGVEFLLNKNNIELIKGTARVLSPNTIEVDNNRTLTTANVIIATGARPRSLPGLTIDGDRIITSREALELRELPGTIGIIGGGAIGVEFAYYFRAYGSKVTIFEMMPHLVPTEDEEVSLELERAFRKHGIEYVIGADVDKAEVLNDKLSIKYRVDGEAQEFECDRVLLGVGVQPNSDGLGLENVGAETERGFIRVDDKMRTNVPGIFAVGDVTGKLMLAHVAFSQGVVAAETAAGLDTYPLDYKNMPRAVYCQPQIAALGLTEAQARADGFNVQIGRFPFRGSGKAIAIGDYEGFVKLITDGDSGDILGAAMIGPDVTEMLAEIGAVKLLEGTATEIGLTIHAHPTLSEAVKEAALAVSNEAIHV